MAAEAPWNILIVEDERDVAQMLEDWLRHYLGRPATCRRVTTLAAGLALLVQAPFDLVLLDLNLPDSQHLASLKAVVGQSPGVPCVVVTGIGDAGLAAQAADAGAAEFIAKTDLAQPHLAERLLFAVARHRRIQGLFRELEDATIALKERVPDASASPETPA